MSSPTHQHMKLFKSLFLLLFVIVISGCSKMGPRFHDIIWDYRSTSFEISIVSPKEQSLIDPTTQEGYELIRDIKVSYDGQTFDCQDRPSRELRAQPEFYKALYVERIKGSYRIVFGEFQPDYSTLTSFTLHLPGGEKHEIKFIHTADNGKFHTKVWVNDIPHLSNTPFNITLTTTNPVWDKMQKAQTLRPVTLYILPVNAPTRIVERKEVLEDHFYKDCSLIFRGKTYPLLKKQSTEEYSTFSFYAETLQLLPREGIGEFRPFLLFGPIAAEEKINGEKLELRYKNKVYTIYLQNQLSQDGASIYRAWLDGEGERNIQYYFHNGPLVRVLIEK